MPYDIDVQVDPAIALEIPPAELHAIVEEALRALETPDGAEVALIISTDEQLREMNRGFRGIDAPTDVLSFAAAEGPAFVLPADLPPLLGDVLVSLPAARRQAAERGRPLRDELALLIVHGCLHLAGYDHAEPDEQREMWALQADILRRVGVEPPPDL
jgi:probable rRNA maturation factor